MNAAPAAPAPDLPTEDWSSWLLYEATFCVTGALMSLGYGLRTRGMHHVPRRGPVLVIANHQSFLDPDLVGLAVRRHVWFLARKSLFKKPAFAWLIRKLHAVPIDQEGIGIEGLRLVQRLLEAQQAVLIFPEGGRTSDGTLQPFMPGIHLLLKKCPQAAVVPVGLAGAFRAWPKSRRYPAPAPLFLPPTEKTLAVCVGPALPAARFVQLPRAAALAALQAEIGRLHEQAERLRRK